MYIHRVSPPALTHHIHIRTSCVGNYSVCTCVYTSRYCSVQVFLCCMQWASGTAFCTMLGKWIPIKFFGCLVVNLLWNSIYWSPSLDSAMFCNYFELCIDNVWILHVVNKSQNSIVLLMPAVLTLQTRSLSLTYLVLQCIFFFSEIFVASENGTLSVINPIKSNQTKSWLYLMHS